MDPLITEMVDAMERVLKLQTQLDELKRDVAIEKGPGTWTFERNGATWVLSITRRPSHQREGNHGGFDVSLKKANKL